MSQCIGYSIGHLLLSALDDEDSTDEILRRMDDKDFDMQRICGEFEQQLACPPTPRLGRGRVALPELYSRAPTPLALYKAPPIVGSRAPTPRYVPASETPFLPMSDDEADAVCFSFSFSFARNNIPNNCGI